MGNRQTNLFDIPDENSSQVCNYYAEHNESMSQFLSYLKNCSVSFKGYDSNSASPSDILELTDSKGNTMIMKYFLVNGSLTKPMNLTSTAGIAFDPPGEDFHFRVPLLQYEGTIKQDDFIYQQQVYELQVYKDKVRPLVQFNICPYFIDFYGGNLDITYQQMLEFLITINRKTFNNVSPDPTANELIRLDNLLEMRFKRNSYLIANPEKYNLFKIKRPALISTTDLISYQTRSIPGYTSLQSSLPVINQYYSKPEGFLNEDFLSSKDFKNARYGYIISKREPSMTFKTFLSDSSVTNDMLRVIIFQICIAHYALYLSGVSHNDAHSGNIFIKDLGSVQHFTYFIDGDRYEFNTRYIPLLYDFDRAYNIGVNNLILKNTKFFGQDNVSINGKDFMKSLCYVFKSRSSRLEHIQLNNHLISLLTKGNNPQFITDLGSNQYCFFEGSIIDNKDNKINNQTFYNSRFYSYSEMIKRMGGEIKSVHDFKFYVNNETDLKAETNCYYLYPEFFGIKGINTNSLHEKIRNLQKNVSGPSLPPPPMPLVSLPAIPSLPAMPIIQPGMLAPIAAPNSSHRYGAAQNLVNVPTMPIASLSPIPITGTARNSFHRYGVAQNLVNVPTMPIDPFPATPNSSHRYGAAQNLVNVPSPQNEITEPVSSPMPSFEELRM